MRTTVPGALFPVPPALSVRRLALAAVMFLAVVMLGPAARAACVANVSASVSGTTLTAVATGSGQCGNSSVTIYLNGGVIGGKSCLGSTSCTATAVVSTVCLRTGSHTVSATSGCGRSATHPNGTPFCANDDPGRAETSFSVNTTPTASPSYSGPDLLGHGTLRVSYNYPNTDSFLQRGLLIYVDGVLQPLGGHMPDQTGVYETQLNMTCWRTGPHVIKTVAIACNGSDPSYRDEKEITVVANSTPEVSVSYVGPDERGHGRVEARYNFPNTDSFLSRHLLLYVDGGVVGGGHQPNVSGTYTQQLNTTCWTPGPHEIKVRVTACNGGGDPDYVDESTQTVTVDNKPTVSLSYTGSNGNYQLQVSYRFPNTASPSSRSLVLYRDGSVLTSIPAPEVSGSATVAVSGCGEITAVAASCNQGGDSRYRAEATTQLPPDACKEDRDSCGAPGKPVNVGSGDVSLTLPLFNIGGQLMPLSLDLTYHSSRPIYPSLVSEMGRGWHHTFSETLRAAGPDGRFLYRIGPDGREYVYERTDLTGTTWSAIRPLRLRQTVTLNHGQYRLVDLDRTVKSFDQATGRWLSTTDFRGNALSAVYDELGNLASVSDAFGRRVRFAATGLTLHEVLLPNGTSWRFTYTNGNVTAIFDPLHTGTIPWRTFVYANNSFGEPRLLREMRDEAGFLLEGHAYDSRNRGTTSFAEGNRELVELRYDLPGGVTRVTHTIDETTKQVGEITLLYHPGKYLATKVVGSCTTCGATSDNEARDFDASSFVTKVTDGRGMVTALTRDSVGNILTRTRGAGTPLARTVTYEYNDSRRPTFATRIIEPSVFGAGQVVTDQSWNADETTLTVTTTGRLSAADTGTTSYTSVSTFDARGRLVSVDGPRSDVADTVTRSYYGDDDTPNRRGRLQTVVRTPALSTSVNDYDLFGSPTTIADPDGVLTSVQTDGRGRVVRTIQRAVPGDPAEATDYVETRVYDGRDRLVEIVRPLGNRRRAVYEDGTNFLIDTVTVDADGNERERVHGTRNVFGAKKSEEWQSCVTPAATCGSWVTHRKEQYTYDTFNRLKDVVHADGTKMTRTYNLNGQVQTVADENHAAANVTYDYDILGRRSAVTTKLGSGTAVVRYGYDVNDNLVSVTDPNTSVTTFAYDDFGRRTEEVSPVSGRMTYTHDAAGSVLTSSDANGAVTSKTYDALNRHLTVVSERSGTATESITFTYDAFDESSRYGAGRIVRVSDPAGTTTFRYDRRGLLTEDRKDVAGGVYVTQYGHDANGNRTRIKYPSGRAVDYLFDYADRAYSAASGATPIILSASYLPFGPLDEVMFGNGTTKSVTYDHRYRMQTHRLTAPGGTIADYSYGYDGVGNITSIEDNFDPAFSRGFVYDDLYRLTAANGGSSLWGNGSYSYDAMGNMKTSTLGTRASTFDYAGLTSRLSSVTESGVTRSVAYDATGNELAVGSESFEYSPRNQLLSGDGLQYVYDWRGLRIITATRVDISGVAIAPASVAGGNETQGTVTLAVPAPAGGVAVALEASDAHATVPAVVHVAAGASAANFAVNTHPTPIPVSVTITASYGTGSRTGTVTVTPPSLASLTLDPSIISGGQAGSGRVVLEGPAPQGSVVVSLSSDSASAAVPSSITVPEGVAAATFTIATTPVTDEVTATITASHGVVTRTAQLQVFSGGVESVSFDPPQVQGGHSATGTVRLLLPAPAGGAVVVLGNGNPALLTVPSSVTVVAGASATTFAIGAPAAVSTSTDVVITATWRTTASAIVSIVPPSISSFSIIPGSVEGGQEALATVTLSGPAAAGTQVTFDSSDGAAWITDALTFAAGATSGQIAVRTSQQAEEVISTLTATLGASFVTASITVRPLDVTLSSFTMTPPTLIGSNDAMGTVTLTAPASPGGVDVELRSLAPLSVSLPPYVTVPEGAIQASLPVSTNTVAEARETTVQARHAVTQKQAEVFLLPPSGNSVTALSVGKPRLVGGNKAQGMVTLMTPGGQGGFAVSLVSSDPSLVTVPAVVSVPRGSTSALFLIESVPVVFPRDVVVTASLSGAMQRALLTIIPETSTVTLLSVSVKDAVGGSDAIGMVVLSGPAPAGGAVVSLSGSRPGVASVPPSVNVPAGATSEMFAIATSEIAERRGVLIQAAYNHLTRTDIFEVLSPFDELGSAKSVQASPAMAKCASIALEPCLPALALGTIAPGLDAIHPADPIRVSLYLPESKLLAETEVSTAPQKGIAHEYIWFAGLPVAQFDAAPASVAWTFTDHLGTPLIQTDVTGQVVWRAEYEPYGKVFTFRAGATKHQPLRLPGQEAESLAATERSYNVFRWYRAGWGRYTQGDRYLPVSAEPNVFAYARENPVRLSDPLGLFIVDKSCECQGPELDVPKAIVDARKYLQGDKCRSYLLKLQFSPMNADGSQPGAKKSVFACMQERLSDEQNGKLPTILCEKGERGSKDLLYGKNACGETTPTLFGGMTVFLWPEAKNCPNQDPKYGLKQTIFHEALHTCGIFTEASPLSDAEQICTGWGAVPGVGPDPLP